MEEINTDSKQTSFSGGFRWFFYDEDILYEKLLEVSFFDSIVLT